MTSERPSIPKSTAKAYCYLKLYFKGPLHFPQIKLAVLDLKTLASKLLRIKTRDKPTDKSRLTTRYTGQKDVMIGLLCSKVGCDDNIVWQYYQVIQCLIQENDNTSEQPGHALPNHSHTFMVKFQGTVL